MTSQATYLFSPRQDNKHPVDAETRAPEYLKAWLEYFPNSEATNVDFEDWAESAVFLDSCNKLGIVAKIADKGGRQMVSTAAFIPPVVQPGSPDGALLGSYSQGQLLNNITVNPIGMGAQAVRAAGFYGRSKIFQKHAGRKTILAAASKASIENALHQLTENAVGEVDLFVKSVRKEFAQKVTINTLLGAPAISQLFQQIEDMPWTVMQYEDVPDMFLLQEAITCRYEYRMFMVDGRPVTSAGCIEEYTPLNNEAVFDPKMVEYRNKSEIVSDQSMANAYRDFAEQFGREFEQENGKGLDYCLDLCINADGKICVIELNPPTNCGLYACDNLAWLSAIKTRLEEV